MVLPTLVISPAARMTTLASFVLGGLMPALFVPWGMPALWLVVGAAIALAVARYMPHRTQDAAFARRAGFLVALAFAAYLLSFVVTTLYHGGTPRELDKAVRFALGAALVLALLRVRIESCVISVLIAFAAITAFGYALFDHFMRGALRAGGYMNEIQFGVLAAQMAGLNALISLQCWRHKPRRAMVYAACALAGLAATVLSGSFTAIASLAAAPLALAATGWKRASLKGFIATLAVVGVVATGLVATKSDIVRRATVAARDLGISGVPAPAATTTSSTRTRLENFANAWAIFKTAPVFGVGGEGYLDIRKGQVARGELSAYAGSMGVAHNEYLDALAKRGVVGLAGLLALLLVPLFVFRRISLQRAVASQPWAAAGATVCIGMGIAALSQNVLTHSTGANFLVLTVPIFLRLALQNEQVTAATSVEP